MANTLNLGTDGNWAIKEGALLGYNSESSNFKPLPFNFTRASTATYIAKDGLIKTAASGVPRIDFLDSTEGSLKLEPQRTNLVTQSNSFEQWTEYNASAVLSSEIAPDGQNAYKIVEDSTLNNHGVYLSNLFSANGTQYVWSVYVKGAERRYVVLTARIGISSNASALIFDTQEGEWVLDASSQNEALFAENVGNDWWRIGIEGNPTSGAYDSYTIASAIGGSTYLDANYQGDGTSGIYIYGAQVEAGNYATSIIKTSGSTATRIAETCSQTPPNGIIGQTEGTIFVDFIPKSEDDFQILYQIRTSGATNVGQVDIRLQSGIIRALGNDAGSTQFNIAGTSFDAGTRYKCAVRYKENDVAFYINGVLIGTDSSASFSSSSKDQISFGENLTSLLPVTNIVDARLYDNGLSNSELATLTTI